jgi:hypothetical protein
LTRAWTLTVLEVLDASRRSRVVRFLYEARLIAYGPRNEERVVRERVVSLAYANLSGCALSGHSLPGIDLSNANLRNADLSEADLRDAYLRDAYLGGAKGVTERKLEESHVILERATMPDGSKHP